MRPLFALRVIGDDDEVLVLRRLRQVLPVAVQHQHVAGAQRQLPDVLAIDMAVAVDRQQADAVALAQSQFRLRMADEGRSRRDHRFGNAGAVWVEQIGEAAQARRQAQTVLLRVFLHRFARAERADHAADPDHLVGRRRQARVVAGLQGEEQRRAALGLGFADGHADQRAVGGDGEFEDIALDAVGAGEITFRARRRHVLLVAAEQALVAVPAEIRQRQQQQGHADREGREHVERMQGGDAGRQVAVRRGHQIVEQDQRRTADHGQATAHHHRAGDRHQQAAQGDAGACRQSRGHRQEQGDDGRILHRRGDDAGDDRRDADHAFLVAFGTAQDPGRQAVQRAGTVQAGAQDHGRDDADGRVAGKTREQFVGRHEPEQTQRDQHDEGGHVGAQALEHEHRDGEAHQPEHDDHLAGQCQAGFHRVRCLPQSRW